LGNDGLLPKISDFGTSGIIAELKRENVGGTLKYMPPEILMFFFDVKEVDSELEISLATDIYALGIILWEIATRNIPYGNKKMDEDLASKIINEGYREQIPEDIRKNHPTLT